MVTRVKKVKVVAAADGAIALAAPALQFVPLDVIDVPRQVRSVVDEVSLAELAADVKANGVLQPVLLRAPVDGRYQFIAGERRIRAARIAGLVAVPALVGEVTDSRARAMQFAENIQREDLSLQDEALAVRSLYDELGSLDAVAGVVHKSKPWVSKRLALTIDGFDWRAKKLLEDGVTGDIELLQCLSKVGVMSGHSALRLEVAIRGGTAGRKEARAVLAGLKKDAGDVAARKREEGRSGSGAASVQLVQRDEGAGKSPRKAVEFDGRALLWDLVANLAEEACPAVVDMVADLSEQQQSAVLEVCRKDYERGAAMFGAEPIAVVRRVAALHVAEHFEDWSIAAFTLGAFGIAFELGTLLSELQLGVLDSGGPA